nr:MAG: nonstructural protein [Microviridae sp.]
MSIMKVCAVYDVKAEAFMPPMFVPATGLASRDFVDAFSAKDQPASKHREDFSLYEVASFDTSNAVFESIIPPRLIFKGCDIGD